MFGGQTVTIAVTIATTKTHSIPEQNSVKVLSDDTTGKPGNQLSWVSETTWRHSHQAGVLSPHSSLKSRQCFLSDFLCVCLRVYVCMRVNTCLLVISITDFFSFLKKNFFYWRIIVLQYCLGSCHTST